MSIKEKDSAAEQPSEDEQWVFDLAAKHEARTGTLFGPLTFSSTSLLDFVHGVAAHLARQSPAPEKDVSTTTPGPLNTLLQIADFLDSNSNQQQTGIDTFDYASQFDYELGHAASEIRAIVSDLAAPVAQEVEPGSAPAAADEVRQLADGYESGFYATDPNEEGGNFSLHYKTREQADKAFALITSIIDRCLKTTASAAPSEDFEGRP